MKKIIITSLVLAIFFLLGAGIVQSAGLCDDCNGDPCDPGLTCINDKCRGCPASGPGLVVICNPIQACDWAEFVAGITGFIFMIALGLAPLMIIIGAFYILTAGADPKRVETGKNIILYTVIGFTIILLGRALVYVIQNILG